MANIIKHIVMWNLRGDTDTERSRSVEIIQNCFESLKGRIPGLIHLEIGVDYSRIDYACDVVLYSEFSSKDALDGYATHPEHLRIKQEIGDLRIARHQVDYVSEGYERLVTHVFKEGGQYLDSDAVFGVRSSLIAEWVRHEGGTAPDGTQCSEAFYTLEFDFVLNPKKN